MTIKDVIRNKLLVDMVKTVNPPGKWKVMVVDDEALRILNTVIKLADLTDEHVISVEGLSKRRQPYPDREVIYFIASDPTSIQRIIDDFSQDKPLYAAIHIFTSSPIPDTLFDKVKRSPASRFIRTFKELNVDFSAIEPNVFTVDLPNSLKAAFNPQTPSLQNHELDKIAKRLSSVLASLGEYPYIRYHDPSAGAKPSVTGKLAQLVQAELDNVSRADPNFPPNTQYQRAILLIVDRAADILTPLIHHFTYQSMVMDILGIEDMKYQPEEGEPVKLDDSDIVWSQARHWHIAEVMEYLADAVNKFTTENKAAAFALGQNGSANGSGIDKIKQMKETMAHLPQYQEMKAKYSVHTNMCKEAMQVYNARRLERVSQIEQDLATGETADGRSLKLSMVDIISLLDDARVDHEDKLRLVMACVVAQNGISDSDRQKLLDHAKLSLEESQAVHNLSMLGVRLSASLMGRKGDSKGQYAYGLRDKGKEHKFENSRYTPVLKYMMEDQIKNIIDGNVFPWIREPPPTDLAGRPQTWAASGSLTPSGGVTMRAKASWANKSSRRAVVSANADGPSAGGLAGMQARPTESLRANGPRIVVFVLGGLTPSEMKVGYDVMKEHQREVIMGSTHLITPSHFLYDLKDLHRHGPQRPPRPAVTRPRAAPTSPEPRRSSASRDGDRERRPSSSRDGDRDARRPSSSREINPRSPGSSRRLPAGTSPRDPTPLPSRPSRDRPTAYRTDSAPAAVAPRYGSNGAVASRVGNIESRMAAMMVSHKGGPEDGRGIRSREDRRMESRSDESSGSAEKEKRRWFQRK